MTSPSAREALATVVRESGLVPPGSSGVALVSGGADSACLAAGLAEVCSAQRLHVLHLNYGLRESSGRDERRCRDLCALLRVDLHIERPELGEGNLQALARDARYRAAERLRERTGADWVATGHTRTDLAETVLYRLATSPGRRALLGLPARRGRVIRPLLAIGRDEARGLAERAGLPFADDPTNVEPDFARNRIRAEVLPVLEELSSAAERNIAATRAELAEEAQVLERLAEEALEQAGASSMPAAVPAAGLERIEPAIRRLALRRLAERAAGSDVALPAWRAAEIWRLANDPEGGEVELGGGLRAICDHGHIRIESGAEAPTPEPVRLAVPGSARFGAWELRAELRGAPVTPAGPEIATLDADALGPEVTVRAWREGDRMRPLGLGGSRSLQDLFTDRRVPRSLRHRLPVVVASGRIAWVAGVAVSDEFRLGPRTREVAILSARARD